MRAVVDTNVIAYFILGTPEFRDEVRGFWESVSDALAPALWEAELANVVWMAARAGAIAGIDAPTKLGFAARLGVHSVPTRSLWYGALLRSTRTDIAVYDTLFVELADREQLPLVTFDQRLLRRLPDIAKRPRALRPA